MIRDGTGTDEGGRRPLTLMQTGVAACMLDLLTDKEAAKALGIAPRTVEEYRRNMVERWGLRNSRELLIELARMTA
jgi:DNA-binding CsgD family transcriptional regulator